MKYWIALNTSQLCLDSLITAHKLIRVIALLIITLTMTQRLVLALEPQNSTHASSIAAPVGEEPNPKDGVLDKMATRVIKLILIFLGAAAAVIFSIVGVRILVSSAVQSSYGMAQGILALLAAGVGVLIALGGPGLAGMLIDAGKDASFESTIKYPF